MCCYLCGDEGHGERMSNVALTKNRPKCVASPVISIGSVAKRQQNDAIQGTGPY